MKLIPLIILLFCPFIHANEIDPRLARLSEAIRFQTISSKDNAQNSLPALAAQQSFLKKSFPLVHQKLTLTKINQSLLFSWKGRDHAKKAILFSAHQDVVPADQRDDHKCTVAPFSGAIKDGFVWGRGAMDDKGPMFSLLEAVEALLKNNFVPEQDIYLAFGHDEEIGGNQGAKLMAEYLQKNHVALGSVFDEGLVILTDAIPDLQKKVALVGISEKGYVSFKLTAHVKGGHSSMPGNKTAIGALSAALVKLEQNPMKRQLHTATKLFLKALAPEMPTLKRFVFSHPDWFAPLIVKQLEKEAGTRAMLGTTTALTMMSAGVKDNILPNEAEATVNFRIIPGDTSELVQEHIRETINDSDIEIQKVVGAETPPVAASSVESKSFVALSKAIEKTFPETIVAPSMVLGSTDSKHYRHIAENIYRFSPMILSKADLSRIHGIDERLGVENYFAMIQFYETLMKSMNN